MRDLIVGAGIAGPTLAYWLSRAGHDVTVVEQAGGLRSGGYLIDFWGAGFDVADKMGIVPELRQRGYVMTEARAINRNGRRIGGFSPDVIVESNDRYVSIARSDLAAAIYESITPTVELVLSDSVQHLDDDGSVVHVTFDSGIQRDFDLVFGADGLHSRIRRLVFGPDSAYETRLGLIVAAFEADHYPNRDELVAMMYADVGFQAVRLSLRSDTTLILFSARHDGDLPAERDAQQRLLQEKLRDGGWEVPDMLDAMIRAKDLYFDSVSQIRMPSWTAGRVALLGDAAACPSFLAGQGSALAMIEAYILATELARQPTHSLAYAEYHRQLPTLLRSKQDAAKGLGLAFAPKNKTELFTRNLAMKVMSLPKVADLIMGRSFHDAITLPGFPD
ncbi:FAD-binding domain [Microbacterium sp. B2969]|uniref:FAD-binding domain n=1 Tax=Microbacterium alkaliflavum TaxID=3248839 RepID=A0ABW7Q5X6_9MICO